MPAPRKIVNEDGSPAPGQWHLDKTVPVAIIAGILFQTATLVWWASKLDSRVSALEIGEAKQETYIAQRVKLNEDRWDMMARDRDRIGRIEEQIKFIFDGVKRIENKLDRTEK